MFASLCESVSSNSTIGVEEVTFLFKFEDSESLLMYIHSYNLTINQLVFMVLSNGQGVAIMIRGIADGRDRRATLRAGGLRI